MQPPLWQVQEDTIAVLLLAFLDLGGGMLPYHHTVGSGFTFVHILMTHVLPQYKIIG